MDGTSAGARRIIRATVVLTSTTAYFAYVCRLGERSLQSGMGDWVDPYFVNLVLEHWYTTVVGLSDPFSLPMFFPVRDTLGYSHGLILFSPIYVALRLLVDPFPAHTLTTFLVLEAGAVCLYVVLRKMALTSLEAWLMVAFFATSANVINEPTGVWSQRASVFLIPPIVLVLIAAASRNGRPTALLLGGAGGLFSALMLTQEFYTAVFAALVLALAAVGHLILSGAGKAVFVGTVDLAGGAWRGFKAPAGTSTAPSRWWLLLSVVAFASAAIVAVRPVDLTRVGPVVFSASDPARPLAVGIVAGGWFAIRRWRVHTRLTGMLRGLVHHGAAALDGARRTRAGRAVARHRGWLIAFGVGACLGLMVFLRTYLDSFLDHRAFPMQDLWSRLRQPDPGRWRDLARFVDDIRGYQSLRSFLLVLFAGVLVLVPRLGVTPAVRRAVLWFAALSALVLVIPFRFGDVAVWTTLFAWMPGLSAVRDPARIIYVYELSVALAVALLFGALPARSALRLAVSALALALLVTAWNPRVFEFHRSDQVFHDWVRAPIDIDPGCRSFFISGASARYMARSPHMWSLYAIDAVFIAMATSIPTLNGYSAWQPAGWELANPQESRYRAAVDRWIERHDLRDVCQLDIDARTMTPYQPATATMAGRRTSSPIR
jgi:hypothetical protein